MAGKSRLKPKITEKNIGEAENETLLIASSTLSALESAVASWDAAREKPEELAEKFRKYRSLREKLAKWMTKMLREKGKRSPFIKRQERLLEFVRICKDYRRDG